MEHTLTELDNGKTVAAHAGDVIAIHLAENATTGYRWAVDHAQARRFEPLGESANYPGAALGAGGTAVFRFRLAAAGSSRLALKYWRHWEGDKSVIRRFAVTIKAPRAGR